jgi:prepilin-type processing-associated H-X9-DG protein
VFRFLAGALVVAGLVAVGGAQPKDPAPGDAPPPLRYTVRTEQGERAGRNRDSVLKAAKIPAEQVRPWAEAPEAAKEARSALLYQDGYVEAVARDLEGRLVYTVRDPAGERSGRDRASVLKTRGMTAEQLKAWAQASEGKAEGRSVAAEGKVAVQVTVQTDRGTVTGRDRESVSRAAKLTPDQMREWAADPKAAAEGRGAILFGDGHAEIVWRGPGGELLYSVRT